MKIVFFSLVFTHPKNMEQMNYVPGGMENYLSNLIHRLKDNHEIVLMIPDNFKKSIVGVKYYQFAERGPFKYISLLKEAIRLCVIEKPKVISAFMPSIASGFLFTVGKIFRIKTAINLRGFEMYNAMNRLIIASSFLVTQYIITNGQNLVRKYAENAGLLSQIILSKPSFFIPNAIDSTKWEYNRQEKKEFDLVYIANINSSIRIEQKGFVYLYEAIEKIHKSTGKRLKTVIIGSYNFNDIKNALPNFNSDSFVFLGLISNKGKIKEYLAKSCIFVLPSTEEGMPNALMEAMAFGIPSVATDVGSVQLLIPSKEMGLIIPPKNTDALVNSILSLIHDEPRRSELSRNAKKFIQNNFSWNPHILKIEKIYARILKQPKNGEEGVIVTLKKNTKKILGEINAWIRKTTLFFHFKVLYHITDNLITRYLFKSGIKTSFSGATHRNLKIEESIKYIEAVHSDYMQYGELTPARIKGKTILEIGPGDNLGVAMKFLLDGAAKVVCLDKFYSKRDESHQKRIYQRLMDLEPPNKQTLFKEIIIPGDSIIFNPTKLEYIYGYGIEDFNPEFTEKFDIILSRSVLQLIPDLDQAFSNMERYLKPGGRLIHKIDLRDYMLFHEFSPLTFLTVPEPVYKKMTSDSCKSNRQLVDHYMRILDSLNQTYKILVTHTIAEKGEVKPYYELGIHAFTPRKGIQKYIQNVRKVIAKEYRNVVPEHLSISGFFLISKTKK